MQDGLKMKDIGMKMEDIINQEWILLERQVHLEEAEMVLTMVAAEAGGYYGGGGCGCINGSYRGGGGGSGYIGGVSNGSMRNGVQSGNGYARITFIEVGE